jgi:hypothetical protein
MKNSIKYLTRRIREEMKEVAYSLKEEEPSLSCLNIDSSKYKKDAMMSCSEIALYDTLSELIVKSTNLFSLVNATYLEGAIEAYEKLIPFITNKEINDLARHCLSSTQNNLVNLEKISRIKELNNHVGL